MKDNLPVVSIIGKPNIGKSTLINRICITREAIVHELPMITRDRKYYESEWCSKKFYILDTGGIDFKPENIMSEKIVAQAKKAIEESDLIIFLVNLREPLSLNDEEVFSFLRKSGKNIIFAGNKWDHPDSSYYTEDYLKLGFGYPIRISAMHGMGIGDLLDAVIENLGSDAFLSQTEEKEFEEIPDITILGKPNVGKSTLFNTLLKEDRVIVDEKEGTTRDTVDSIIKYKNKKYRFIDTAGMKRNRLSEEDLEYYSKLRTVRAIEKSDIGLVLVEGITEISKQDVSIVETCLSKGTAVIVVFTKSDITSEEQFENNINQFDRKLHFAEFIPFLKVSALKRRGLFDIFKYIDLVLEERKKEIPEKKLMDIFKMKESKSFIYSDGKKFKIKFMKQIGTSPPSFIVFSNMDLTKKTNIQNYIEKTLRQNFDFTGNPIKLKFKQQIHQPKHS